MSELKGKICAACEDDLPDVVRLAFGLWPEHDPKELEAECADLLKTGTLFALYEAPNGVPVGFAQCQLRHDYVEGTETSPVGYLEGIYVEPAFRGQGIARELLHFCEDWAREKGCREFASDCELTNTESLHFHLHTGFREANRIICFCKKL